ncbi:MAG: hypothetical protein M1830_001557 [Pleopsidium flavum]|nr:MAG: hypothetical protein M1830_001557 [Pleopsidium flavum]
MSQQQSINMLGTFTRWRQDPEFCEITVTFNSTYFIVLVSSRSFQGIDGSPSPGGLVWQRLDDASFEDDDNEMNKAMFELIDLAQAACQPLFRELSPVAEDPPPMQDLDSFLNPNSVMLELVTLDGTPNVITRENTTAPRFEHQSVDTTSIDTNLPKLLEGEVRFCKLAGKWLHDSLPREILSLQQISKAGLVPSIKVPSLKAFIVSEGDIIGILIDYIPPSQEIGVLDSNLLHTIAKSRKEKWAIQVEETLRQLHNIDVIWGDVKPANVLVDKNDDAWIIDFGGGRTEGWIDEDLSGTKEGDLQGLKKIRDILKA